MLSVYVSMYGQYVYVGAQCTSYVLYVTAWLWLLRYDPKQVNHK